MLQNASCTAFTVSELLRKNNLGGWGDKNTPFLTQVRVELRINLSQNIV